MSGWAARLAERAIVDPAQERRALRLAAGHPRVGSLEPALAHRMAGEGLPVWADASGWCLQGEASNALAEIAHWLHAQGLGGRWRNELLAVTDATASDSHEPLATIERAAVRPLGITTHAVHLIVRSTAGGVWVQQRALDKATDPGLWDTTMGGLRSAHESVQGTLERETWEEAGLRPADLQGLVPHGRITVRRPVPDGYLVERTDAFAAVLRSGATPVNQDGEVAGFACIEPAELRQWLQQDRFTLEAALVLLRCLPELR